MLPSLLVLMNSKRRNLGSVRGLNDVERRPTVSRSHRVSILPNSGNRISCSLCKWFKCLAFIQFDISALKAIKIKCLKDSYPCIVSTTVKRFKCKLTYTRRFPGNLLLRGPQFESSRENRIHNELGPWKVISPGEPTN